MDQDGLSLRAQESATLRSVLGRTSAPSGSGGRALYDAGADKTSKSQLDLTFIIMYIKLCSVHFYGR